MIVQFIGDDTSDNAGDIMQIVEMEVVPRIGETVTFLPTDDGQDYKVTHVDYEIKNKRQHNVTVWLL